MVIFGCGIDIIENTRIKIICNRNFDIFIKKIFSSKEIIYNNFSCYDYKKIAARLSLKESFVKAAGVGIGNFFSFKDIQIFKNDFKKPCIFLSDKAKKNLEKLILNKNYNIHCSMSHENLFSVTQVIVDLVI